MWKNIAVKAFAAKAGMLALEVNTAAVDTILISKQDKRYLELSASNTAFSKEAIMMGSIRWEIVVPLTEKACNLSLRAD